jgi:hypothetical protein
LPRARRIHLKSIGHICAEIGRVYRAADAGVMQWADASAASRILRELRQALEGGELEARIPGDRGRARRSRAGQAQRQQPPSGAPGMSNKRFTKMQRLPKAERQAQRLERRRARLPAKREPAGSANFHKENSNGTEQQPHRE